MAFICVCFRRSERSQGAGGYQPACEIRRLREWGEGRLCSAKLRTICGEYLLKTCVRFLRIYTITVLVCVLKLQNGLVDLLIHRLEDVQEKPRDAAGHTREVKTEGEHRRYDTSSVGRAAFLHSEQLSFLRTGQFRATAGRDVSSAHTFTGMSSCVASD